MTRRRATPRKFWCPRPESNRHGREAEGFSCHFGFRRRKGCRSSRPRSWSGARLHRSLAIRQRKRSQDRLRLRCPPSALYTFRARWPSFLQHRTAAGLARRWLGAGRWLLAIRCTRAFADFDGLHLRGFPNGGLKFHFKSLVSTYSTTRAVDLADEIGRTSDDTAKPGPPRPANFNIEEKSRLENPQI